MVGHYVHFVGEPLLFIGGPQIIIGNPQLFIEIFIEDPNKFIGDFSFRPPYFHWRPQTYHWRSKIFIGDPRIVGEYRHIGDIDIRLLGNIDTWGIYRHWGI